MVDISASEALDRLLSGNRRYVAMHQLHPHQSTVRRATLATEGQNPFAAILSCSDSRVPSELVFDQGLGDLFIVRTAGHAVNDLVLASLEYAVFVLHVRLIVVMGHGSCGAIQAVMQPQSLPGHLPHLVAQLRPAVAHVALTADNAVEQAIRANARYTAAYIGRHSPVLREALAQHDMRIEAAYYDMVSGAIELLGDGASGVPDAA